VNGKQAKAMRRQQPAPMGEFTARVNPADLIHRKCECGSTVFVQAVRVAILPATHPQNTVGKEATVTIPVLICAACQRPL
jgi:hypothetical protein